MSSVNAYSQAINAYQRAARGSAGGEDADTAPPDTAPGSFAGMVKGVLGDAMASGRHSEEQSVKALTGGADLSQVITAVAEAVVALQSVVAIRDKVVEAYKDIMRMPI